MSTTHDRTVPTATTDVRPPTRCLRHRVWMAACGDCRDAHRELLTDPRRVRGRMAA